MKSLKVLNELVVQCLNEFVQGLNEIVERFE